MNKIIPNSHNVTLVLVSHVSERSGWFEFVSTKLSRIHFPAPRRHLNSRELFCEGKPETIVFYSFIRWSEKMLPEVKVWAQRPLSTHIVFEVLREGSCANVLSHAYMKQDDRRLVETNL